MEQKRVTLYFVPGACSFAPHVALREVGANFELQRVDLKEKKTQGGEDYMDINPLGYVPALRLPDDSILTEATAILLYIADQHPESNLVPETKTLNRYQEYHWLTFVSSELHKSLGSLFNPNLPEDQRNSILERVKTRFSFVDKHLGEHNWLVGDSFTIADIYAFVVLGWSGYMKIDMSPWPHVQEFLTRIGERPTVKEALIAEQS